MSQQFSKSSSSPVTTIRQTGVTSSAPGKVHKVPRGSAIKIWPTSEGTATVYSTNTPRTISDPDDTNTEIINDTAVDWDEWSAGAVTSSTSLVAQAPVETVAIVVTSGTWVLEVSA
jgi:hypothetical protein